MLMVTSALQGEGKSTTTANLAVALARAGKHVLLLDFDLRRPTIAQFFGLEDKAGVSDVVLGRVTLDQATAKIDVGGGEGLLEVLPAGTTPPDAGEFVGTGAVAELLSYVRHRADVVLIDAPPLLNLGDAITLSGKVDGLVLVTRLSMLRRPILNELARVVAGLPSQPLGYVLTAAGEEDGADHGYDDGAYYYQHAYGRGAPAPTGP
jgi:capsular exopolysaccharide synthesis family protein